MQRVSSDELSDIDYVFTDSRAYAPFRGRNGAVLFLENISEFQVPQDLDATMEGKTELLSVLMPAKERLEMHRIC